MKYHVHHHFHIKMGNVWTARINAAFAVFWTVMVVPTLLWWKDSVLWVAILSVWALIVSHTVGWIASRAPLHAEHVETKVEYDDPSESG